MHIDEDALYGAIHSIINAIEIAIIELKNAQSASFIIDDEDAPGPVFLPNRGQVSDLHAVALERQIRRLDIIGWERVVIRHREARISGIGLSGQHNAILIE